MNWTESEISYLEALYPTHSNAEIARDLGRARLSVKNKAQALGLKKAPPWTADADALLRELYPDHRTADIAERLGKPTDVVYRRAYTLGLRKSEAFMASEQSGRLRAETGKATRFQPGQTSWNKGKSYDAGGRSVQTRFQPGHKPHTWQPVGTEVWSTDGYLKRKVADDDVPSRFNWRFVHVLVWEEHHGPVPDGHVVTFRDGDRSNFSIENLECIPRSDLGQRNVMWNRYPRPVAEVMHLRGQLRRRIREKQEDQ